MEALKKITVSHEEVIELLKDDCQLPEHIRPKPEQKRVKVEDISVVLLTGVTGTLGPYILKELCNTPQIWKVICLIRPSKGKSLDERLNRVLEERGLLSDVDMSGVETVQGDLGSPNLGLDSQTWDKLCDDVDAVFHLAAAVSHVELYRRGESRTDGRTINVEGTRTILQFASSGKKVKHVYNASSLVAAPGVVAEDGNLAEEWPTMEDYLNTGVTTAAYSNTKFVGDMLMKEAVKRGIPGKSFRFPIIGGDSKTGRFVLRQNHLMLRFLFSLKHGVTFTSPWPIPFLPVDICAWASVKTMLCSNAEDSVYNVSLSPLDLDSTLVDVARKLGYKLETLKYNDFVEKLKRETTKGTSFAMFRGFYKSDVGATMEVFPIALKWMRDEASNKNWFTGRKIKKYLPELPESTCTAMDHIYRDLLFAKQQGWI